MLRWEKDINGYNGHWMGSYIGFEDDCPLYKVGENEEGWYYDNLVDLMMIEGYDTAEEAMAAAEAEAEEYNFYEEEEESLLDVLDNNGEWDAYWDAIAHERIEIAKGLF